MSPSHISADPGNAGAPPGTSDRWLPYIPILVAVFLVFWWFLPPGIPYHPDTARDLLQARQIAEGPGMEGFCPSSSTGFCGGTLWHRILSVVPLTPCGEVWFLWGLLVLQVTCCMLVFHLLRVMSSWPTAGFVLVCYLFNTAQFRFQPLWQPTLSLPLAELLMFFGAQALATAGPRVRWLLAAQIIFSLGMQSHLGFILFTPALVVLSVRVPRSWWSGVLTLGLTSLAGWFLISPEQIGENLRLLGELWSTQAHTPVPGGARQGVQSALVLPGIVLAAALVLPIGSADGPGGPSPRRIAGFVRWTVRSFLMVYFVGLLWHGGAARYILPVAPFFWVMVARSINPSVERLLPHLSRPLVRCGVVAALLFSVVVLWFIRGEESRRPHLLLSEIRAVRHALDGLGYDIHASYRAVRPLQAVGREFNAGLWVEAPCLRDQERLGGAGDEPLAQMLLVVVPPGAGAEEVLPQAMIRLPGGGRDLLLIPYESWVVPESLQVCGDAEGGTRICEAYDLSFSNRTAHRSCVGGDWPRRAGLFLERGEDAGLRILRDADRVKTIRTSLRIPPGAGPRILYLPAVERCGAVRPECAGRIIGTTGLDAVITGDGRSAILRGGEELQQGSIEIAAPWLDAPCRCGGSNALPGIVEVDPAVFAELMPWLDGAPKAGIWD